MKLDQKPNLAIFYCQNVPESSRHDRNVLEKEYGKSIRFFSIPCAGRLDYVHLLKALEEFADAAYVIACAEDECKYFEGNRRAVKRLQWVQSLVQSIGLERERLGIVMESGDKQKDLGAFCEELVKRASELGPSPVHK